MQVETLGVARSLGWRVHMRCAHGYREETRSMREGVCQVLQRRSPWAGLCGLAVLGFLELLEIVHIEVAVGLEPVLVSFDGKGSDEASAGV